MKNRPLHIALVGGIAVGKTTILKSLGQSFTNSYLIEEDVNNNIFLSDFYQDMKTWAFHSRISTIAMIVNNYLSVPNDPSIQVVLMDRCIDELITFAQLHYEKNNMSSKEFAVYKMLYNSFLRLAPSIDLFIYITCSAQTSLERIKKRNRVFEQGISIDYINAINGYYQEWINSLNSEKVLRICTDDETVLPNIIQKVKEAVIALQ